jgi:hypothetical protein
MRPKNNAKWRIVARVIALTLGLCLSVAALFFNVARTASFTPGISTPTSFIVTLNRADLQQSIYGAFNTPISTQPTAVDVVADTGLPSDLFVGQNVNFFTYNGIRLTFAGTALFSGVDPCTGNVVTGVPVPLPSSVNGEYIMQYQVPHPIKGVPTGAIEYQPFTITADNQTAPFEFRVVFPVSNSIACISASAPTQTISGINTGIGTPYSIYMDTANDELGIANNAANSITVYRLTDSGNVLPERTIQGPDTGLNGPLGLSLDSVNDEIAVSNSDDNSIAVYGRTDSGDAAPHRIIQGSNTDLNGPGDIYVDTVNNEIGVANGGGNAITIYQRTDSGNVAPQAIIQGSSTNLSTPCGIYYDSVNGEIVVGNNGNNSITVYQRPAGTGTFNIAPVRSIQGPHTGLNKVCGLYVDTTHGEIAVANSGGPTITFYDRLANGDVYPIRTIEGASTGLASPSGLYLDTVHDDIGITDLANNAIFIHSRADASPYLIKLPALVAPTIQQNLYASSSFSGNVDTLTGQALSAPTYNGYGVSWQIYDTALRQPADAINATLIPPTDVTFTLADGSSASNLQLGCAAFVPFYLDTLSTACKTQPLIIAPAPPVEGVYHVGAELLAKTIISRLALYIPPLTEPELPRLVPTLTLSGNDGILNISWQYVDASDTAIAAPLIYDQSMTINLAQNYSSVSSCYTQVSGNALTLVYSSGALTPDVRSLSDVKNNRCDIFLHDVATITFTTSDALGNKYVYTWSPS